MKIRIRGNAADLYANYQVHTYKSAVNWDWYNKLEQVQGTTIEVETRFLFQDQFNTPPIDGVSESGLRIMAQSVEEVIDDVRPGKMRCQWDGEVSDIADTCPHCGKDEYLSKWAEIEPGFPVVKVVE